MTTLTFKLDEEMYARLQKKVTELHIETTELIQTAIENVLHYNQLDCFRKELEPFFSQVGMQDEEDIFSAIS